MNKSNHDEPNEFTETSLPDLDTVVMSALELFKGAPLPKLSIRYTKPLVAGSESAGVTARMLCNDGNAVFASENDYKDKLKHARDIDGVVVLSSSGGKHAPGIARYAKEKGLPVTLLTNNPVAQAREYSDDIIVFPKNREPYTYNTSTYLGMILSHTHESPEEIELFIGDQVAKALSYDFSKFNAFCFIIPPAFHEARKMFETKFTELFGSKVCGRVFTSEEIKHAKTVVPSDTELFISFGEENTTWGDSTQRLYIPLPENSGYGAMMAIGYYVIGRIQAAHPPYFKDNIATYVAKISEVFDEKINVIVE